MLPAFGTLLSSIPHHHIAVDCYCGHGALVEVRPVLDRLGPGASVGDLLGRVRCSWCRSRNVRHARIVFAGASDVAMDGATAIPKREGW